MWFLRHLDILVLCAASAVLTMLTLLMFLSRSHDTSGGVMMLAVPLLPLLIERRILSRRGKVARWAGRGLTIGACAILVWMVAFGLFARDPEMQWINLILVPMVLGAPWLLFTAAVGGVAGWLHGRRASN